MTFPTIPTAAAGRALAVNQANTTATRTFPSLSSLTKNSGDLLVAIVVAYQTSTGTNAAFSGWGGSFTEFHDSATSTTMAIGIGYKWSTGSETGTFTVTQAGTITGHASMILLSIPGAHLTTPPEANGRVSPSNAVIDITTFNPTGWDVEDTLWIMVGGSGETSTTGSFTGMSAGDPTNYVSNFVTGISGDVVGGVEAKVAFRQLAAASEDPPAFSNDTSNARGAGVVIAVRPVPTPTTGSATGSFSFTGSAVGDAPADPPLEGAGTGTFTFAGAAVGTTARSGTGTGAWSFAGAASGEAPVPPPSEGSASGTLAYTGTATGTTTRNGAATGTVTYAGTASGGRASSGSAAGGYQFDGTATGARVSSGSATGTHAYTGTSSGVRTPKGSTSGGYAWDGSASGSEPSGVPEGSASGSVAWTGGAAGSRASRGAASGGYAYSGTATGPVVTLGEGHATIMANTAAATLAANPSQAVLRPNTAEAVIG